MRGWKSLRKTYRVPFLAQFSCNKPHEWILRLSLPSSKIKVNEARVINLFFLPWRPIERNPVHSNNLLPTRRFERESTVYKRDWRLKRTIISLLSFENDSKRPISKSIVQLIILQDKKERRNLPTDSSTLLCESNLIWSGLRVVSLSNRLKRKERFEIPQLRPIPDPERLLRACIGSRINPRVYQTRGKASQGDKRGNTLLAMHTDPLCDPRLFRPNFSTRFQPANYLVYSFSVFVKKENLLDIKVCIVVLSFVFYQ